MAGRHRFAALLGLGAVLIWALAMALTLAFGALPDSAEGRVAAVFPRGTAPEDMLAAVALADGVAVSGTWFENALVAEGGTGFVGRLRAAGGIAAYRSYSADYLMLGGCFFVVTRRA